MRKRAVVAEREVAMAARRVPTVSGGVEGGTVEVGVGIGGEEEELLATAGRGAREGGGGRTKRLGRLWLLLMVCDTWW